MDDNTTKNSIDIQVIKKDVENISNILTKFDAAVDKLHEISSNLTRIVNNHEEKMIASDKRLDNTNAEMRMLATKLAQIDTSIARIHDKIVSIEKDFNTANSEFKELKTSVNSNLVWRWMAAGAIAVVLWLLGNVIDITQLFTK